MAGESETVGDEPDEHFAEGGEAVTEPAVNEGVVQVGLVGMEGRESPHNAHRHHTEGVEDGDDEQSETHRHESDAGAKCFRGNGGVEDADEEPGGDDAHRHGAGVADEHTAGATEDVVEQEGHDGGKHHEGEQRIGHIAQLQEADAEEQAAHHAESGGEAVDAIHHIDGVDDAHAREHGERHRHVVGQVIDAPQSVEGVDALSTAIDEDEHGADFEQETRGSRHAHDVVEGARIEHHGHHQDDRQEWSHGSWGYAQRNCQSCQHADVHGKAAEHRHGFLLQFARLGVVEQPLHLGEAQHFKIHPEHRRHSDQRGEKN